MRKPVEATAASNSSGRERTGTNDSVVLSLKNVKTHFHTKRGILKAVDGVDLDLHRNSILGVVGESGCGKSVMSLSVLKLLPVTARLEGQILYCPNTDEEVDLSLLDQKGQRIRSIRGAEIAMIFQEPMTALNPLYTIGNQIVEAITLHQNMDVKEAKERAIDVLTMVGMPIAEKRVGQYPHQLSGGLRQRAMIAMALSCNPKILIADEPTTALDVTIQAQILDIIKNLRRKVDTSVVLITHDLGVIAGMTDQVAVMYLGKIVEYGTSRQIFKEKSHPYTEGLFHSIPKWESDQSKKLISIKGVVPDPMDLPPGCRFYNRCSKAMDICDQEEPPMFQIDIGHQVRCWLYK